ncbi:MAG TPA: hypothetical protein VNX28_08800 [Gemmataceae bacterium]|nr:hypothetical protein [Gemmataceae bacterium]
MQVEFIHRLRSKGYNDLALEHIDKLKADPALASVIELERARTLLAMARQKDPAQRPPVFAAALAELEAFVRKNPSGPAGAQGRLEIARLAAYQGQTLLTRALREEDTVIAKKAEQQFIQAGQELGAAVKVLADVVAGYKSSSKDKGDQVKQQLVQDLLQARFDRARNFVDQALTYIDTSSDVDNRKRAEMIDQAKQAFKLIAIDGGPVGLLASAWLVKVNLEGQDPTESEKHRKRVMEQTGPAAQPAQRLAKLFYMQGVMKNPTIKLDPLKKYKLIEDKGKEWLASYPTQHNTLEGLSVRFELAQAMFLEAQAMAKDGKGAPSAAAMAILSQAQKHFTAIGESDSSFAEKAKGYNVNISVIKLGEGTTAADLKDFENCYLKAQVEIFKMRKVAAELANAPPKSQAKLEAERRKHLEQALKALSRGIMLADAKTTPANLDEARFLLASGYLLEGDLYRAAVAGEALGRARPPSKHSAQAAGHALECYATILARDNADSNRQHLQELAEYIVSPDMQKQWAAEPVTSVARYQLAMLHNKDNAYKEAIAELDKLAPDFSGYIYAQGQLVFIAQEAREKAKTEEEKNAFADMARRALGRIPNLPGNAGATTAAMYFFAHLELAKFYYADAGVALAKKERARAELLYNEMAKHVAGLKAKLEKAPIKLAPETRASLDFSLAVMAKHARLGLADLDYHAGNYDKVLRTTDDVVAAVEKLKGDGSAPIRLKDYQVTGDILGLALRANVQKGNTAKAKDILNYLDRLTGEEAGVGAAESANVLRTLIGDLQSQVRELKKANEPAKLKATVKNFSAFIDELKAKKEKGLELKDIMFLATCYSSLEEYAKAAKLYKEIPPPKALEKDKLQEDEEKEIATYWFLRVQYAKALRLSAKGKEDLGEAKKVLDALLQHKNARLQVYAEVEQIHILQDAALYGLAMKGWSKIMGNPTLKSKLADDSSLKDLYFNAYYENAWCLYKYSQSDKVVSGGQEKKYLRPAANYILKLEKAKDQEGWQIVGHKCRELLVSEKKLRDEYDDLKKTVK